MNKQAKPKAAEAPVSTTTHTNIYAALIAARAEFSAILKASKGHNYKYADLVEILNNVQEPLANHGLFVVNEHELVDGHVYLSTRIVHAPTQQEVGPSRFYLHEVGKLDDKQPYQKIGVGSTYGRRYNLNALLNLAAEDNDGAVRAREQQKREDAQRDAHQREAAQRRQAAVSDADRRAAHQAAQAPALDPQIVNTVLQTETVDDLAKLFAHKKMQAIIGDKENPSAAGAELLKHFTRHKAALQAGGVFLTDADGSRSDLMPRPEALDWLQVNVGHSVNRDAARTILIENARMIERLTPEERTEIVGMAVSAHGNEIVADLFAAEAA